MVLAKLRSVFAGRPQILLNAGHPTLRTKALPVDPTTLQNPNIQRVITQMRLVFDSPYTPVVGLAAPQIGHPLRIIAYRITDPAILTSKSIPKPIPLTFLVNPVLTITDKRHPREWNAEYESCESVPMYNAVVRRAEKVHVQGIGLEGERVAVNANGFLARVLQHEIEHLDGKLFVDVMEAGSLRHDKYIDKYEFREQREQRKK
ncbi:peptide deformylase [Fimicolochytrium jonesii]|uniref:peptide deformylase n=1 Tax=Fimicolochytrium jonesii TaxID=1396493 RepID=UPI0022FDCEA5|nr:peptide deformylase [Fimicolochytrium jonesii]KAI8818838.1 peptide deformylase [Fimicolochytrium jonesii]